MKLTGWRIVFILVFFVIALALATKCEGQPRPFTNRELVAQIQERARQQQAIIDEMQRQLGESRATADHLWNEAVAAQQQANKVQEERDGWRKTAENQIAEVSKYKIRSLRLTITIGVMASAIAAYSFGHFYLRILP